MFPHPYIPYTPSRETSSRRAGSRANRGQHEQHNVWTPPTTPQRRTINLPSQVLSPLVDHDSPLPDIPFVAQLNHTLRWGPWRQIPSQRTAHRRMPRSEMHHPATEPPVGQLMMLVTSAELTQQIRIRPGRMGRDYVSVSDVIEVAKEMEQMSQRSLSPDPTSPSSGSFAKNHEGILGWYGLGTFVDENGDLVLNLRL